MKPNGDEELVTRIRPDTPDSPLSITLWPRRVAMFYIFERELDTLGSDRARSSLYTSLFGTALGAALALGITLATVDMTNPHTHAIFWAAFLVSLGFTVFLGVASLLVWKTSAKEIQRIKAESRKRESEFEALK